jgi:hypothetical protein
VDLASLKGIAGKPKGVTVDQLLVRPPLNQDELALAYSLRLSELNGLQRPYRFGTEVKTGGHGYARICPLCMAGSEPYWHQSWNDLERPWCDVHDVWLSDTCTSCGRRISWGNAKLSYCPCGHAWSELPALSVQPSILSSLRCGSPPFQVLRFLGAIEVYGLTARPVRRASHKSMAHTVKVLEAGDLVASALQSNSPAVFDRWRLMPEGASDLQLFHSAFPGLARALKSLKSQVWHESLLYLLDAYVTGTRSTSFPIVGRNKFLSSVATQKDVATELGIRFESLSNLLEGNTSWTVATRSTARGRRRAYIASTTTKQMASVLADRISAKQAALHLSISPTRLAHLVRAKLIWRVGRWLSRSDLEQFQRKLSQATEHDFEINAQVVRMDFALRNWVPVSATVEFFRAVMDKRVRIGASDCQLCTWMVDCASLQTWRTSFRSEADGFLSIPEAAVQLGLKQQVVYGLVNSELIHTSTRMLKKRSARCISSSEVKRFQAAYAPLATLARHNGVPAKLSLEWARSQGMKLATGPLIDGGRQYFVESCTATIELTS